LQGRTLWCDARKEARGFYQKLGFVMSDEVFEKSGIEYVKAQLDLEVRKTETK